ncbi:hypothetical protein BDV19DRAFT_386313 [Aspergillus venezuelensis]
MIAKTTSGPASVSSEIEGWSLLSEDRDTMPIAVIGMACRFSGGAETPAKLWDMLASGKSGWSPIKKERFHGQAWYHPDKGYVGTTNVKGAHFIEDDIALFDASFFSFSSDISSTMDPEVRLQLETSYEALENAGLPLHQVAGTKTGVFAGTSFRDNHDNHMRDPGTMNDAFFVTGNGAAMVANRVSHFYDLRGPSVMVDTGCSTSLTLLHLACQSLRMGECEQALVGGSALLINPEMFIAGTKLGIFSPQGKSFAFDHRADGYGRGDGIASIVLKPLSDALRDGDAIRAIIRNTAVNQDGKTTTITSPSPEAQMSLMKSCYAAARLDPLDTGYVEAHGTGTQTGDVIEGNAIGTVFGQHRSKNSPLVIGSVKTNIGHTEATSGLAAVIKVVLALEHGRIPPQINFEKANPALDLDGLNMKVPTELEHWPAHSLRRASVNNFGYGGANAHAIIEHPEYLLGVPSPCVGLDPLGRSRVFTWSAKDQKTVEAMTSRLQEYLTEGAGAYGDSDALLDRLAYTLSDRRTRFPWSMTCSASSRESLVEALSNKTKPARRRPAKAPRLGFVFTGQGAQWHAMGRELIPLYPAFRNSLLRSDKFLAILGSPWSLLDELSRDEENSRVNEVAYSLPLSVAVQVALIDLLRSWNINPAGVTGHSSGEVSAAYAAGLISHQAALAIVYCRGDLTKKATEMLGHSGGMCAVGLGREEAQKYIDQVTEGELTIACVNSPVSVTVSGDRTGLDQLEGLLATDNVFARRLKVNAAYHSHHMLPIAEPYGEALARWVKPLPEQEDPIIYSSPTTGRRADGKLVAQPDHWVRNMTQPVEFVDSLRNMCLDLDVTEIESGEPPLNIDFLIEVGPHGALGGPIRQTLSLPELKEHTITYGSCLTRKENAVTTMQNLASTLLQHGYPVDLNAVNFPRGKPEGLRILTDLPPYPWNHSIRYWREPRISQAARERTVPPHDILGRPTADFSTLTPTWRHLLRLKELPWLRDHVVQGSIIFPGAGYLSMALEAMRQIVASSPASIGPVLGYQLENIDIQRALVLEDNDESVEVRVSLRPSVDSVNMAQGWYDFHIQSLHAVAGKWIVHCEGRVMAVRKEGLLFGGAERPVDVTAADAAESWETISGDETYSSLSEVGLTYGPLFQNQLGTKVGDGIARSIINVPDTAAVMPYNYQQPHLVHPTTLDTAFQAMFHALPPLQAGRTRSAMVPKTIRSIHIAADMISEPGHHFAQTSKLNFARGQGFETSATISNEESTKPVLTILGLFCQSVGAAATAVTADEDRLCFKSIWKPDVDRVRLADVTDDSSIWLDILVRLLCHKRPGANILEVGAASGKNTKRILTALGASRNATSGGSFDVTDSDAEKLKSLQDIETSETVSFKTLDLAGDPEEQGFTDSKYDLVVLSSALESDQVQSLTKLRGLVNFGGRLVAMHNISKFDLESAGWTDIETAGDGTITLARASQDVSRPMPPVAIVSSDLPLSTLENLEQQLHLTLKSPVTAHTLSDATATSLTSDTIVVFVESSGDGVLSQPTEQQYTCLQSLLLQSPALLWVSTGAHISSESPFSALHSGLLRTLDLENQGTQYASLDFDIQADLGSSDSASHIAHTLYDMLFPLTEGKPTETEFAVRNNIRHISRVHEDTAQNNLVAAAVGRQQPELRPFKTPGEDLRLISTAPGLLQNLTFVKDERPLEPLPDDWVEVQPFAYGLNFRDLMIALDQLNETRMGYECAGILTKVTPGAAAQGFKVGDRVYLIAVNCFVSTLRLHYDGLAHLPDWLSFKEGASLAMVHTTAYHCLYEIARLEKGESILIHSGSGGVGQSAIMMAKNIGATIFVTVGSESKRKFIQETYDIPAEHIFNSHDATFAAGIMAATDNKGVDVVLNSLAGPLLRATWSCVAPFGRFVEIGKRDIEQGHGLSMAPFAKCLSFFAVDLLAMFDKRPRQFFGLMRQVDKMVARKEIGPVGPILEYSMGNLESAFRIMQEGKHMGKIVLCPIEGDMVKVLPVPTTLSLPTDGTYLLVGGLGGIGASIARRLAARGARNLVLMSRSATSPTEEQKVVVRELEDAGVNVMLRSCDVANRDQLASTLADLPTINGVIQGAMVLRDGIFEQMSHENYMTTVKAKVQGTYNLHELLPQAPDMQFFIMLASISGAGGNAGQANYAAGNTFQDALARHRSSLGLPGIAIDLGAVKAVGVLAEKENAATAARLARVGLRPLEEEEVLRLVESAIQRPIREASDAQIITGIPAKFVRPATGPSTFWHRSSRFVSLEHADTSASSSDSSTAAVGSPAHTRALLANCTSKSEARTAITGVLVTKLASEFGRPESDIEPSLALTEIGVDSLIAVELRNWIAATLDADCSIFDVMQSPSLSILVDKLVGKSRLVKTEA